ncbi:thiamine-phosphate kinase [Polymorphobacter megasporae]|uniref:thiamine-phosphate kinase n=1 Tax=Glacieibacterium megasporae TaxID=2835787 RepID=UPI001C1E7DF1|nr:thiamine-phosphate kinase [Polymorphobacter megasporae]UAJ09848.1 thiamine-phosphate kinase [Polymorphobacter megasporae]
MRERDLIARLLAPLATSSTARGLADDAAVFSPPIGRDLVFTHDILASGVHYLPGDNSSDVAWKLLAVNLSDLAAMGARPAGVLLGLGLSAAEDEAWVTGFAAGLKRAMDRWGVPLWGGDTVSGLAAAVLGLTAIGQVEPGQALARSGANPGDTLWVSGTIGDAGLGLAIATGEAAPDKFLLDRYRRPEPRLALGQLLVGQATAAMDVSDGLLIDAERLASASGVAITIDLALLPVSPAAAARTARDDAGLAGLASAGDDYELLFTLPPSLTMPGATLVGSVGEGEGLIVLGLDGQPYVPSKLGYEH